MTCSRVAARLFLPIAAASIFTSRVYGMPMTTRLVLFSDVRGVVLDNGKPITGVEVERSFNASWRDVSATECTKTDSGGKFFFKSYIKTSLLAAILPHQPYITQKIIIRSDGKVYEAWVTSKTNYKENGELDGKPIDILCDISDPPKFTGKVYGICRIR